MRYQNAENVLPRNLLITIQKYVDGNYIYIPRKEENRKCWGQSTSTRKEIQARNESIYNEYLAGIKIKYLSEKYYLSIKSIERIVYLKKNNINSQCS